MQCTMAVRGSVVHGLDNTGTNVAWMARDVPLHKDEKAGVLTVQMQCYLGQFVLLYKHILNICIYTLGKHIQGLVKLKKLWKFKCHQNNN